MRTIFGAWKHMTVRGARPQAQHPITSKRLEMKIESTGSSVLHLISEFKQAFDCVG